MRKVLLLCLIIIIGFSTEPFVAWGEPTGGNKQEIDELNKQIEAKKKKIQEIEQAIADYKKKIEQARLESVSLGNQMAILDNRIAQVELDVAATLEKLAAAKLEIERLTLGIEDKTRVVERQKVILAELIRHLYQENNKKQIEILAAYDNFSDFYSRVQYLQKIETDLGSSAKTVRLARADLETKKSEVEAQRTAYENLNRELNQKKTELQGQINFKQKLLADTQSSELKYKTLVSSLKTQYQQIENEISGIEREVRRKLEEEQKKKPEQFDENSSALSWPTQSHRITAYFRDTSYPYRQIFEHNAIDIAAAHGTAVKAAASGYIARAKRCTTAACYSYVMIVHSGGISTVYGHLSRISADEDQFVTRGDIIGYSGATPGTVGAGPFTTGPHLHFEVRKNGIPVNPLNYLP
ncbi:MAG: Peptidase M23B [Candidatus Magasanikbacteria bacterium GW2011_GWA2_56_11]|uniref:Peptidase M23B n=1 Tax=Candidatus Magasanikbacteria bacterium GW2011_GWA2_56_11 TaxID=1619044 RepID=A0A0G2AMI6_9BACT|nr:MAG: Peptidase M23B [Candidatus Magasanikbacteria bacterium GW2011_GWA2_56_11]